MKKSHLFIFILLLTIGICPQHKIGKHTVDEWRYIIDTTWGPGQPTEEKLQIFDAFWNAIDQRYAGFNGIVDNWQQLKSYRDTVALGVSRGRFAGILNYLIKSLHDLHVWMRDGLMVSTPMNSGVPLLYSSGVEAPTYNWGAASHFGAALTPLPDSTLLVYSAIPNHPLGLVPGDVVLGYDGKLWKYLYKELLEVQFPMPYFVVMNSSERAATHQWLQTAGMNWHLFDTIDVVKYGTNDTLHFSTNLLSSPMPGIYATEQLPINGVPFYDVNDEHISWGYVEGSKIAYIYARSWSESSGDNFLKAINTLMSDSSSDALIIDVRINEGGTASWMTGLKRLFNKSVETMRWLKRASLSNHLVMEDAGDLYLTGCDAELYDRPIAVLCGPSAVSNGDWFVHILRDHPMVRTFGLPTNGAFGDAVPILGFPVGWFALSSEAVLYSTPDMNNILSRQSIPVDEEVWLSREGVANGKDDVVERALEWMKNLVYVHNVTSDKSYYLSFEDTVHLSAKVENPNAHQLICRAYRRTFEDVFIDSTDLIKQSVAAGRERWIANLNLPSSEEFYKISLTLFDETTSEPFQINDALSFTTAGPVKLDSILYRKGLLNYHYIRPFVHNWGTNKTIPNPAVKIICNDPWIASMGSGGAAMPNIAPDSTVGISSWITIGVIDSLFPGYFNFKAEIMSNGWVYWKDSTKMIVTAVEDEVKQPLTFTLEQNYPNPFNPTTTIGYILQEKSNAKLTLLNALGEEIAVLVNEEQEKGYHKVEFDGSKLTSGVYFYQLRAGNLTATKKLLLLK